jgi:predicted DNA-binding transcriptional regulator AlpA
VWLGNWSLSLWLVREDRKTMSVQASPNSHGAAYFGQKDQTDEKREEQPDLPASLNRDRVLDSEQTAKFLGISVPHFRRLYRAKKVPPPIMIGYRKYGWQAGVLVDFVAAKTEKAAA